MSAQIHDQQIDLATARATVAAQQELVAGLRADLGAPAAQARTDPVK